MYETFVNCVILYSSKFVLNSESFAQKAAQTQLWMNARGRRAFYTLRPLAGAAENIK